MNDEIKEILDNFKIYEDRYKKCNETQFIIFYKDIHLLLDYITNLQNENEDYKSRIDKAVEYIKLYASYDNNFCLDYHELNNLLNILQNGSDEE